ESYLINYGGYEKGDQSTYDKEKAIDMDTLIRFIKSTQPKQWERYRKIYREKSEESLYKRFDDSVRMHGLLNVLRNGIRDRGVRLKFAFFKAESGLNQKLIVNYNINFLTFISKFYFFYE